MSSGIRVPSIAISADEGVLACSMLISAAAAGVAQANDRERAKQAPAMISAVPGSTAASNASVCFWSGGARMKARRNRTRKLVRLTPGLNGPTINQLPNRTKRPTTLSWVVSSLTTASPVSMNSPSNLVQTPSKPCSKP